MCICELKVALPIIMLSCMGLVFIGPRVDGFGEDISVSYCAFMPLGLGPHCMTRLIGKLVVSVGTR